MPSQPAIKEPLYLEAFFKSENCEAESIRSRKFSTEISTQEGVKLPRETLNGSEIVFTN